MKSIFDRSTELLTGVIFNSVSKKATYTHLKSFLNDAWYNFIIPHVPSKDLSWDETKELVREEKKDGYSLSYYVPEKLAKDYQEYFAENNHKAFGTDFFMLVKNKKHGELMGELIETDDSNIDEFVSMAKVCFSDWDNEEKYARHFYKLQKQDLPKKIKNYIYTIKGEQVGFGAIVVSAEDKLSYIHNTGVLPEHRRRGHFTSMTKHLINESIALGASESYALVEENEASYYGMVKMGFSPVAKFYLFDTNPSKPL